MRFATLVALAGSMVALGCGSREPLPELGSAPEFVLTSQEGVPFSSEELAGKTWVTYFFFTSCAGPCPVLTQRMAELTEAFPDNDGLRFVSMSVDPATDTPARLRDYAEKHNADLDRWVFLTGEEAELQRIAKDGFKLGALDEPMMHSNRFILVDGKGIVRGTYNGLIDEDVEALHAAVKQLAAEQQG